MKRIFNVCRTALCAVALITTTHFSVASETERLNQQLSVQLGQLVDVMGEVQSQNGPEVMAKFGQIYSQNPDEDALKALGESVNFSSALKSEFDRAAVEILETSENLIQASRKTSGGAACQTQLDALEPEYQLVKAAIQEAVAYSVAQPVPKAKAYIAVMNALPLSLTVSKLSMLSMMVCRSA